MQESIDEGAEGRSSGEEEKFPSRLATNLAIIDLYFRDLADRLQSINHTISAERQGY